MEACFVFRLLFFFFLILEPSIGWNSRNWKRLHESGNVTTASIQKVVSSEWVKYIFIFGLCTPSQEQPFLY